MADDEISHGPERELRLPWPPKRGAAAAAIAALAVVVAVLAATRAGQHHATSPPRASGAPAAAAEVGLPSVPPPDPQLVAAAPGTVLLTCDSAVWGLPWPDWRASSLQAGALWLVGGSQLGFVHPGRDRSTGRTTPVPAALSRHAELLVHVDAGSVVVLRAAPGTRSYFRFRYGGGSQPLASAGGFTVVPCAAGVSGSGDLTDFFELGFAIAPGRTASVEVATYPAGRTTWLTITAPSAAD